MEKIHNEQDFLEKLIKDYLAIARHLKNIAKTLTMAFEEMQNIENEEENAFIDFYNMVDYFKNESMKYFALAQEAEKTINDIYKETKESLN